MVKRLKEYETAGQSGSIYTEPFDVEIEENGLITYDREVVKVPSRNTPKDPCAVHCTGTQQVPLSSSD